MPHKVRTTFTICVAFLSVALLAAVSLAFFRGAAEHASVPSTAATPVAVSKPPRDLPNFAIQEDHPAAISRHVSSIADGRSAIVAADAILIPDWQVLFIAPPSADLHGDGYSCLFRNNVTSPASRAWLLPSTNQTAFICDLPPASRRRPLLQPELIRSAAAAGEANQSPKELLRWNFLVYESFSVETDVVVFAKGVNHRQGFNRPPSELSCVFSAVSGDGATAESVRTAVTSSEQEVFRCPHPPPTFAALPPPGDVGFNFKVSLEIKGDADKRTVAVPSVARYAPHRRTLAAEEEKALLCACTMVYNVAKFLREWVTYHSSIGVQRFVLYDNGSDDDLEATIQKLREENFDVRSKLWPWPKTQEAGFSHAAISERDSCTWMIFIDVDEFVFSPNWLDSSAPSKRMLPSLLPKEQLPLRPATAAAPVGEISIMCNDFGPSGQREHPAAGVTQGYTCRRRREQRHKSAVLLEAVEESLLNVIHHFKVRKGYRVRGVGLGEAVVNHYKYQAWPEFKAKFRRRVSAYVVDWRVTANTASQDRTPGLGFEAVEPKGWAGRFCEVRDLRLQAATERWFGVRAEGGIRMAWE